MLNEEIDVGQLEAAEVQCRIVFSKILNLFVDFVAGQLGLFVDLFDLECDAVVLSGGGFLCRNRSHRSRSRIGLRCWRRQGCFS